MPGPLPAGVHVGGRQISKQMIRRIDDPHVVHAKVIHLSVSKQNHFVGFLAFDCLELHLDDVLVIGIAALDYVAVFVEEEEAIAFEELG